MDQCTSHPHPQISIIIEFLKHMKSKCNLNKKKITKKKSHFNFNFSIFINTFLILLYIWIINIIFSFGHILQSKCRIIIFESHLRQNILLKKNVLSIPYNRKIREEPKVKIEYRYVSQCLSDFEEFNLLK